MLFRTLTTGAVLSLVAAVTVSGFVVPVTGGVYKITSLETRRAVDLYRTHPTLGDPVVSDAESESDTQNWAVTIVDQDANGIVVTLSGGGANETIHTGGEEGDGLETAGAADASAFQLKPVSVLDFPAYWLTLDGDETLAVTGYTRRSQLTLERLETRTAREAWVFSDVSDADPAPPANGTQS